MKPRTPQLLLRLEADALTLEAQWCAGARVAYLGASLSLVLDTTCRMPERIGGQLHLPLPPAATQRQIRDAAESWLRDEAQCIFSRILLERVAQKSALAGRQFTPPPRVVLVFGKRSDWVRHEGGVLRCHWRLVEQPTAVIEQVLGRAWAVLQAVPVCDDLFALA